MSTDVKPYVAFGAGLPNSLNGFSLRQGHQLSSENQTGRVGHANPPSKPSLYSDYREDALNLQDTVTDEAELLRRLLIVVIDMADAFKRLTDGA